MKAILMSIKPKWVDKILNGEKTIEIRKKFPSDYVGWVYIYCTKKDSLGRIKDLPHDRYFVDCVETPEDFEKMDSGYDGKGKVVARFWCDKVEEILSKENGNFYTNFLSNRKLLTQSCLAQNELRDYMAGNWKQKFYSYWYGGYAIHITKLEIFDKPKELSEFSIKVFPHRKDNLMTRYLTRAPQSWCYVEV